MLERKREDGKEEEELLFSFVGVDTRPEFLMMGICQQDDLRLGSSGIRKKNEATTLLLSPIVQMSAKHTFSSSQKSQNRIWKRGSKIKAFTRL